MGNIHYIGHSLGTHIANFVAKHVKDEGQMGRITGLDPAHPNFAKGHERLYPADAEFVDVIHSGMAGERYQLGNIDRLGSVEDFPTGGFHQPGCWLITCDHSRAYKYFIESTRSPANFVASKCFNWDSFLNGDFALGEKDVMGWKVNKSHIIEGDYYLETPSKYPYGYEPVGAYPSHGIKMKTTLKKSMRIILTKEMILLLLFVTVLAVFMYRKRLTQQFKKCFNRASEADVAIPLVEVANTT